MHIIAAEGVCARVCVEGGGSEVTVVELWLESEGHLSDSRAARPQGHGVEQVEFL